MKKTVKAWAVKSRSGGIETDRSRMPIYWLRRPAKEKAEEYYGLANGNLKIMRVSITYEVPQGDKAEGV